jgi:thiamine pyrophosphokinase
MFLTTIKQKVSLYHFLLNPGKNDFGKAVDFCMKRGWEQIFCFGAFGGRMDLGRMDLTCHDASNIQILQTESKLANSSGGKTKYNASHKEKIALSDKNQSQITKSLCLWTCCFWSC